MAATLTMKTPRGFALAPAVCSYGYFVLAPNLWDKAARALHRPLRGEQDRTIRVRITQKGDALKIACDVPLTTADRAAVRSQVARMLRLDEDFAPWFALHPAARRRRFARLFRSPTLFEDLVKTFTCCNVTWANTLSMNRRMCEHYGGGAFPTPAELAAVAPGQLKRTCRVGYRAERIVRLAGDCRDGRITPDAFEDPAITTEELFDRLRAIHGIGPYAAGNMCQLLGRYDRLAIDSETYRHYCKVARIERPKNPQTLHPAIEARYAPYRPYQFLAYWFELWTGYEQKVGDAQTWDTNHEGAKLTAS
jgi:3-methyladenine DNA glycosylase/8-oxoguanine DNA glycosylase